jgi:hypothetical protein
MGLLKTGVAKSSPVVPHLDAGPDVGAKLAQVRDSHSIAKNYTSTVICYSNKSMTVVAELPY